MDKKAQLTIIGAAIILLSVVTITYGFFVSGVDNSNPQTATITTGTMELTFADNDTGVAKQMIFGESIEKKFTLENTGTVDATAYLYWKDLVNTYLYGSLVYKLEYSTTVDGSKTVVMNNAYVPRSETKVEEMLSKKLTIPTNTTYYYTLTITLVNSETVDQTADLNATFTTGFDIKVEGDTLTQVNGNYLYLTDVTEKNHNLNVSLTSDTIIDFSDITVNRTGKNLLNINTLRTMGNSGNLSINNNTFEFTKTNHTSSGSYVFTDLYLPAGDYTISGTVSGENLEGDAIYGLFIVQDKLTMEEIFRTSSQNYNKTFVISQPKLYRLYFYITAHAGTSAAIGSNIKFSNIQIECGTAKTDYEEYTVQSVKAEANGTVHGLTSLSPNMTIIANADVNIQCEYKTKENYNTTRLMAMPSKTYAIVGETIELYFLNLTKYNSLNDVSFVADTDGKGTIYSDKWVYTPTAEETINLNLYAYDKNGKIVNEGSFIIEIKDKSDKEKLSVIVIGDSIIGGGVETKTMLDLASADNYDLTLLGTLGSGTNKHEGRSGWATSHYTTLAESQEKTNAFWNPNTKAFDFEYYMTSQGYSGVDCVSIQLGTNDLITATETTLSIKMQRYFNNMEKIIDSIHAYNENIKIVWNLILPGSIDQSKFLESYQDVQNAERYKLVTYSTNLEIIQKYSNKKNVYIAHTNSSLDVVNNMREGATGAVHPSSAGNAQTGTTLYSFIRAIN